MFDAPALTTQLTTPETLVCRCENVTLQMIEAVISPSCHSIGTVKKATRAGMGRCQGRYCGVTVAALIARSGHAPPSADEYFAPRPPFKPLPLRAVAGTYGEPPTACELLRTNDRYANISS
ncbi:MAG: (2Fe-2S)-binding protein [Gammaproteobacteria bacterium]|nr:(2Fe-2S)-binding protein [Gammaproteobacteria bacterium]MDH4254060.1 (2Fe-2S)-binding protein [Gammaproteobacteria bacterium]MDH5309535.1 (2Fe-2S)-binding protein [Gammaproteobacteria bacterium]